MKSRNKIFSTNTAPEEYKQACLAATHGQWIVEEIKPSWDNARQLYATEAEDYFFYFIAMQEINVTGIAV